MPIVRRAKTAFTAGELAPELLGRGDVPAWANGALRLRNVFIQPTGGITRRPGLRHVETLPGPARLAAMEVATDQVYLLAFLDGRLRVWQGDAAVQDLAAPWNAGALPQLQWTQDAQRLLVLHPDLPVQQVSVSSSGVWQIAPFAFEREPFLRVAPAAAALTAGGTEGVVSLTASLPVFAPTQAGSRLRIEGRRALLLSVQGPQAATVALEEPLDSPGPTTTWEEAAFSGRFGHPVSACFHQGRLVLGGSRAFPNRLFLSRTGAPANFDAGEGLDDEAIQFSLVSDSLNAIRAVFAGRHLQVFTSGAEWMVSGEPLTPASIQVTRQTRVGSPVSRALPPLDVDGVTVFAARSGRALHEFDYTEVSGAYQSNDLALIARHLLRDPVSMAYDGARRLLHVATADGALATLTLYRGEGVTGWTRQETEGVFRALAEADGTLWAAVERWGTHRLERFDDALALDAAVTRESAQPAVAWGGLAHLNGRTVGVLADGAPRARAPVASGTLRLAEPARSVQLGLAFAHAVEPMPPETAGAAGARTGPVRLVSASFRLLGTGALSVDLGQGARPVPLRRLDQPLLDAPPPAFTGDVTLRGLGWRRDGTSPLWRIEGDAPLPFTLLSVTTETRTTD